MRDQNIKQSILTKVVNLAANPIVVSENLAPEGSKFILCDHIYQIYAHAYQLAEFKFKEQHQKYVATPDSLENLKQELVFFGVSPDEHFEAAVDRLINDNLRSADEIIQKIGVEAVVIADNKLPAVRKVLKFHPIYVITCEYYLSIRGGKQLLEQVLAKTKSEFKGLVPGQFKFNHGGKKRKKIMVKESEKASSKENVQPETTETYDDFFN